MAAKMYKTVYLLGFIRCELRTAAQNEYEIISVLLRIAYQILRTAYQWKPATAGAGGNACTSIGFVSAHFHHSANLLRTALRTLRARTSSANLNIWTA